MKIVTSLSFQGQCREAFEFYAKVLGGTITAAMPYGDAPPGMPISGEKYKTWLMHCWLEVGDQALMGADMDVEWARNIDKPKNGFDVTLHTDDKAEAKRWFDQLSEGGKQAMPFGETFWSPASAPSSTGSACRGWSTSFPRLTGSRRRADQEHRW
jgi:PhnB protein